MPALSLDPSTWIAYYYTTHDVESLRIELSRLLHCSAEFQKYTTAENGCMNAFGAFGTGAFRRPESIPYSRLELLHTHAISVLRINLAKKGIVMEEKRQRVRRDPTPSPPSSNGRIAWIQSSSTWGGTPAFLVKKTGV